MKLRGCVRWFADVMEKKLRENDDKGGWDGCGPQFLLGRLMDERDELLIAIEGLGSAPDEERVAYIEKAISEAADVANFAMMIADVLRQYGERLKTT